MALAKKTFTLGADDCKVFPITADSSTAYTVGAGIDVPTVQGFTVDFEIDEKELFGDETIRDIYTKCKKVTWTVDYGELDLDLQAAIMGGTVVTSGTGATEKARFGYSLGTNDKYFQLGFQVKYTDQLGLVKNLHIYIMKCKINANSFTASSEEYGTLKFGGSGINTTNALSAGKALYIDALAADTNLTAIVSA